VIAEARSEIAERRGRDGRKVFGQFVSTSIVTLAVVLMSSWYNYGQRDRILNRGRGHIARRCPLRHDPD